MGVRELFNYDIDLGKSVETIVKNEVIKSINWTYRLANKLDDNMSEFYKAAAVGCFSLADFVRKL